MATFFACIAVYETVQPGFGARHVLIWWAAVALWAVALVVTGIRAWGGRDDDGGDRR